MAFIQAFGHYLPDRVLTNADLARTLDCDPAWIFESSGIEERRIAGDEETVASMAEQASRKCLNPKIGLVILSTGTSPQRFPGPASQLAQRLGLAGIPAFDVPMASAGSLFALALAAQLAPHYGTILVAAAEKMSEHTAERNTAILFGDGAGACLITDTPGKFEIIDSVLHSDGTYADSLRLPLAGSVQMDGRTVILQASRRIPAAIRELLDKQNIDPTKIHTYLLHQANNNLTARVAKTLAVPIESFYSNIRARGNTSSASMLIAASEWQEKAACKAGDYLCFATFGAGFHWGALLARTISAE